MEKVISIVGAGGKTTLVHKLAREYHRRGKGVLVTTTTHMYVEADTDLDRKSTRLNSSHSRKSRMPSSA